MKPAARKLTKGQVEKIIQYVRCVARKEKPRGRVRVVPDTNVF